MFSLHGNITGITLKGKKTCGECGAGIVSLIFNNHGIFSRCSCCGFFEWEWAPGDKLDYLDDLSQIHGIPKEHILRVLEDALE